MKRVLSVLLVFVLLFSFAACGSSNSGQKDDNKSNQSSQTDNGSKQEDPKPSENDKAKEPEYTVSNYVIVDNEYCTVTLINATKKKNGGVEFKLLLENKTSDKNMMFSIDDVAVNGWMVPTLFADSVSAGKKSNETLSLSASSLNDCGITSVDKMEFLLRIYDDDDWLADEFVEDIFTVYPTGISEADVVSPERTHTKNEVIIVDNDKCSFIILGTYVDSIWGYTVLAYLENKTDNIDLMFSWDGVSVNGFMIDPFWATTVTAGNKKISEIDFSKSSFEENDIKKVDEIEFELRISDDDDWSAKAIVDNTFKYNPVE